MKVADHASMAGGVMLSKPANTLDFAVPAGDLGIALPVSLHLHATVITSSLVTCTDSGFITGMMTIAGEPRAYRANVLHETGAPTFLGAMTPLAVGVGGTVVGYRTVAATGATKAVLSFGQSPIDLTLTGLDAATSAALDINAEGQIIGTWAFSVGGAARGFRWLAGRAQALPVVGTTASVPVAQNDLNQIAVNGVDAAGRPVAALLSERNTVTLLGVPPGATSFQVKSLNNHGWAVGVATSTVTQGLLVTTVRRAWAWVPGSGFRPLSGLLRGLPVADDALHITDGNTVVVHGTTSTGVTNLFLLSL